MLKLNDISAYLMLVVCPPAGVFDVSQWYIHYYVTCIVVTGSGRIDQEC